MYRLKLLIIIYLYWEAKILRPLHRTSMKKQTFENNIDTKLKNQRIELP